MDGLAVEKNNGTKKEPKIKKEKIKKQNAPKKKKGKFKIVLLIIFALLIVAALCFSFNVGGMRKNILGAINNKRITEQAESKVQNDNKNLFTTQKEELEKKKAELDEREAQLNAKDQQIQSKIQELKDQGINIDGVDGENGTQTDAQTTDGQASDQAASQEQAAQTSEVENSARMFEKMDAGVAANILSQYSNKNKIVQILLSLNESQAADILSEMPANQASSLLQLMDQKKQGGNE